MDKKLRLFLGFVLVSLFCISLTACNTNTKFDDYQEQGYKISVTYDANGGSFLNRPDAAIVDMFNPDKYRDDTASEIHIKLLDPTSPIREHSGSKISLTLPGHFLAGWYSERTPKTVDGNVVDEEGNVLIQNEDGTYAYSDGQSATPAYEYDGYWDFENDTLNYSGSEIYSLTLYAGWIPFYEFEYYNQNEDGEWELYNTSHFDYKTTNAPDSSTHDRDTIWMPAWKEGAMNYSYTYADMSSYVFPSVDGYTFDGAYTDPQCQNAIVDTLVHPGQLDLEHGIAINPVQKVYVAMLEGEFYKIETAQQLVNNPNLNGIYEIYNDLDFTGLSWPNAFMTGQFAGKICSSSGETVSFTNINAKFMSNTSAVGGIFGQISQEAVIENVSFENAVFDLYQTGNRLRDAQFGSFAGYIEEGATLTNVSFSGSMRLGAVSFYTYELNLLANGSTAAINQVGDIALQVYGRMLIDSYKFNINPETVVVDNNGQITLEFATALQKENEVYDIEY